MRMSKQEREAEANAILAEIPREPSRRVVDDFMALFDDIQSTAAKLHGMIELVRGTDPETADKLAKALKAFGASL